MADPLTIIGIGASALGFIGSRQARRAARAASRAAGHRRFEEAQDVRERTRMRVQNFERQLIRERGERVAALGANGITLTGSAVELLTDAAREGEIARQVIEFEGKSLAEAMEAEAFALMFPEDDGSGLGALTDALGIAAPFIPSILSGNANG